VSCRLLAGPSICKRQQERIKWTAARMGGKQLKTIQAARTETNIGTEKSIQVFVSWCHKRHEVQSLRNLSA